jgi:hypothetical protein
MPFDCCLPVQVGIFSTEKVSFTRVFVDQFTSATDSLRDLVGNAEDGIDINASAKLDKPVLGAMVTMQQEW